MAAFVREEDRIQYGFAHVALRRVLGNLVGMAPGALRFSRGPCPCCGGPHGRPVLAMPATPVEFSLSHGGGMVLIGVAGFPIGVDVEPVPDPSAVAVPRPRLHPNEQALLAATPDTGKDAAFARLWVRKEAYLKALGTGLARGMTQDDVSGAVPGWHLTDLPLDPSHAAAVAVRTAGLCDITLRQDLPESAGHVGACPSSTFTRRQEHQWSFG